ncbi:MAG: MBL fold metallo-hydrolase [Actinomycetota bacterium]
MRVQGFTTGVFQSNTYLIAEPEGDQAVIVDPGQDAAAHLLAAIEELGVSVQAVLLTHGHVDHVWNAAEVARALDVPTFLHDADRYMLEDPGAAVGASTAGWDIEIPDTLESLRDEQKFTYGSLAIETRHTPGHTPGHCVFLTDGLLVSGDLIFAGSVGRIDFPGGSMDALMASIREVVLPLADDVTIISGHGPATTVGTERTTNPFIRADEDGSLPRLLGL